MSSGLNRLHKLLAILINCTVEELHLEAGTFLDFCIHSIESYSLWKESAPEGNLSVRAANLHRFSLGHSAFQRNQQTPPLPSYDRRVQFECRVLLRISHPGKSNDQCIKHPNVPLSIAMAFGYASVTFNIMGCSDVDPITNYNSYKLSSDLRALRKAATQYYHKYVNFNHEHVRSLHRNICFAIHRRYDLSQRFPPKL